MDFTSLGIDLPHAALIAALVLGLTQSFKQLGLPTPFLPLVAGVLGAAANIWLTGNFEPYTAIAGMVLGFTTSGVVNLAKK